MNRWISVVLGIVLITLLASCSSAKETQKGTEVVKQEPIDLVFYYPYAGDYSEESFMRRFGDSIKQKFPYITPKLIVRGKGTEVQDLISAGSKIDILFTSIGASDQFLTDVNIQYDISPLIKKYNYDLNRIDPVIVDMARKQAGGNALYGLPVSNSPSVMYYNKDLFNKFGVPYPKDGSTWDEVFELSKKLTRNDGGQQYYGFSTQFDHMALLNQLSLPIVDTTTKKAVVETEQWKRYMENLVRFYQVQGYDWDKTGLSVTGQRSKFFKDRTVAMWVTPAALIKQEELGDMNWDMAPIPTFKELPGVGSQPYPNLFYPTTLSKYQEQAFQVIAYLTSDEFQLKQSKAGEILTVLKNKDIRNAFGQEESLYKGKNTKALLPEKYAPAGVVNKYNSNSRSNLNSGVLTPVILGQKDINTALRETAESIDKKTMAADATDAVTK